MVKYFKVLDENGRSCHGGDAEWSLPNALWGRTRRYMVGLGGGERYGECDTIYGY